WFRGLPQGDQELPMFEAAAVFGVSDAELLKKACEEYRAVAEIVFAKAKEMHAGEIPADFKLPTAESREVKISDGPAAIYWYKMPPEFHADDLGIDPQLVPNAGLSKSVAVLSFAPRTSERLLVSTPLTATPDGPLSDRKKPLASAVYFNWAGTVDAVAPWIDLLARVVWARSDSLSHTAAGEFVTDEEAN